jgi:hypothetical protein
MKHGQPYAVAALTPKSGYEFRPWTLKVTFTPPQIIVTVEIIFLLNQLKFIFRSASELLLRMRKIALVRLFLTRIKPILVILFFVSKLVLSQGSLILRVRFVGEPVFLGSGFGIS